MEVRNWENERIYENSMLQDKKKRQISSERRHPCMARVPACNAEYIANDGGKIPAGVIA